MTTDVLRSVALAAATLAPLAARCDLNAHDFGGVPVELRSARADVCGAAGADALGRATASFSWVTTSTVAHAAASYVIDTTYSLVVDAAASRIEIVLPGSVPADRATDVLYFCPLLGHEIGHLVIAGDAARTFAGKEETRGASLEEARTAMTARVANSRREAIEQLNRDQAAYDTITRHGVAQHNAGFVNRSISEANVTGCR